MKEIISILLCVFSAFVMNAQVNLTIGSGAYIVSSGSSNFVMDTGNMVNNGTYMDSSGLFIASGGITFSGSGVTRFNNFNVNNAQQSTVNSLVSVYNTADLIAGNLNANNNLYIRSDANNISNLVVAGVLTNNVQGIIAHATVTSGTCPSYTSNLSLNISGPVVNYQWQSSPDSVVWSNVSGATLSAYTATVTTITYYRCNLATTNSTYSEATPGVKLSFTGGLPVAGTITGIATVCPVTATTLSDATASGGTGTWSSNNVTIATVGATGIVTAGTTSGTTIISYTVTNSCGSVSATEIVTVNPLPNAGSIGGTAAVCTSATTDLTDGVGGGVWSSGSAGIAIVGSTGIVTGVAAGTAAISYTVTNSCGAASATIVATVNSTSAGTVTGPSIVTVGSNITLSDAAGGGTWNASNTNATVSSGLVTGITAGTVIISYTVTGTCGAAYATKLVTVNNATISGITGSTTICAGSTTTLSDATPGGTWSCSNVAVAIVGSSTGIVTGGTAGTAMITYTQGGIYTAITVTVNAAPLAINGTSSACLGVTVSLSDDIAGGTWSSSNTAIATISSVGVVSGVSVGSVIISYSFTSGCAATANITVNAGPPTISGSTSLCLGGTATLTDATAGGVWTSSNTSVATIGSATGLLTGVGTATAIITYTTGGCYITATVTVSAVPSAILGTKSVCTGSATTLSDGTMGGTWSTLAGSGGVSLSGTGTVSVTGVTAGTATISYIMGTGCSATAIVTVNASPSAIGGNAPVCIGSTLTLTDATGGGTWTSSNSATAAVGSGTGIVTGVAAGVVVITYSTGGSCIATANVTVNATIGAITGVTSLCQGLTVALSDATSGGAWSSSNTATGTVSTTGVVTGLSAGTTNITYAVSGCSRVVTINVNAAPTAINGAFSLCGGTTTTLTDATAGGTWSLTSSLIATIGSATGLVTASSTYAGTTTVSYSSGGCPAVAVLTVSSRPNPIQGATSECVGVTITLSEAIAGGTWSSSNADVTLGSTGGSPVLVTGVTAGAGTITYSLGASCYVTIANTVYADPAPITGPFDVCTGYTVTLSDATGGGAWTSSAPAVASASGYTISGVTAGTATITYKIPTGSCLATQVITVNASPVVTAISGPSSISHATPATLSDATAGGVWTSSHVAVISLSGSTGSPVTATAAATSGTATISYAVTSGAGCTTTVTKIISATQVPPPHGATTGTTILFAGTIVNLVDDMAAGLWSSSDNGIATVDAYGTVTGINPGIANITHTITGNEGVTTNVITIEVAAQPMNVSVIPNPNKGTFTVSGTMGSTRDEEVMLEVTDVLGQVIYTNKVTAQGGRLSEVIMLSNTLTNGIYMLSVVSGTDHKVFHFVMEK